MYRIHNNLHNDVIDLRLAKRRFLTDAEVFEFAKMNGANKTERTKLIQYNKNFKDHHVFSVRTYKQVPAERSKVLRTADNLLRDLKLGLLFIYNNYSLALGYYDPSSDEEGGV